MTLTTSGGRQVMRTFLIWLISVRFLGEFCSIFDCLKDSAFLCALSLSLVKTKSSFFWTWTWGGSSALLTDNGDETCWIWSWGEGSVI